MGNLYLDTWKADVALSLPSYMGQGSLGPSVSLHSLSEYEEQPDTTLLSKLVSYEHSTSSTSCLLPLHLEGKLFLEFYPSRVLHKSSPDQTTTHIHSQSS